ncbi:glycosyltransferase family 61 protein [Nocardioides daejeonensis]|uniref:glycosyltransferase family 61 protein n=1 Tax=Nocardioides daejeonensis TaxID=1046556 RepID=UPI000D749B27|nr:glycosyltransferase family 61 protein [Nocardioides daejeonensis]
MVRLPAPLRPLFPYLKPAYVGMTGLVAPVTQRLSRSRGGFLPTGFGTLAEAAVATDGRYAVARPAERVERPPLRGVPAGMPLLDPSDGQAFATVGVAELPGGRVLGPHHAVISAGNQLVQDVSWYFGTRRPRQHPVFLNPRPAPPLEVDGRLGVLTARGDANYYHYLMDVVTKLGVLEQAPAIAAPTRWYASVGGPPFQRELLELAGLDLGCVIDAHEHPHVRAETLVVPAPPEMTEKNPPWAVTWLRERLLPRVDTDGPPQRIYVTRGASANNRTVLNDDEVVALLREHGFVAVDPGTLSVREQIRTFATAEAIVATHGAALANLVFASPGSTVIELFPEGCLLPDYWRLASGVPGLDYRYLSAPGKPPRLGRGAAIVRDIRVDVPALRQMLEDLG